MNMLRCFIPLVLVLTAGCGGDTTGLPMAVVSGSVTYQGKPLGGGRIAFLHPSGQARGADIGIDGRFTIVAFQGKNQVAVECFEQPAGRESGPRSMMARKSLVPDHYVEFGTSGLTLEVKPGENKAEFDLKN
jgi:hypothetical protein